MEPDYMSNDEKRFWSYTEGITVMHAVMHWETGPAWWYVVRMFAEAVDELVMDLVCGWFTSLFSHTAKGG